MHTRSTRDRRWRLRPTGPCMSPTRGPARRPDTPPIRWGAADKVYASVGAHAGRVVIGYYTRAYSPAPTATDRSRGIAELDSTTGNVVPPTNAGRANAAVCLDWAVRSSSDNFATEK